MFGDTVLAKVRSYRQNEGDRFTIIREDGTSQTSKQRELRSEALQFRLTDIQARGEVVIFETVAKAHSQIAVAGRRLFSEKIEEEPINRVDVAKHRYSIE
jgi:RPA family protein